MHEINNIYIYTHKHTIYSSPSLISFFPHIQTRPTPPSTSPVPPEPHSHLSKAASYTHLSPLEPISSPSAPTKRITRLSTLMPTRDPIRRRPDGRTPPTIQRGQLHRRSIIDSNKDSEAVAPHVDPVAAQEVRRCGGSWNKNDEFLWSSIVWFIADIFLIIVVWVCYIVILCG